MITKEQHQEIVESYQEYQKHDGDMKFGQYFLNQLTKFNYNPVDPTLFSETDYDKAYVDSLRYIK